MIFGILRIVLILVLLLVVFAFGYIVAVSSIYFLFTAGTLHIETDNPTKDKYTFIIEHLERLEDRKYVLLKVEKTRTDKAL